MHKLPIPSISQLNESAMEKCQWRLDNLTKPLGSLHSLEHIALQLSGITGLPQPNHLNKALIIFAADAVDADSPIIDPGQLYKLCHGTSPGAILANHAHAQLWVINTGLQHPPVDSPYLRSDLATLPLYTRNSFMTQGVYDAYNIGRQVLQQASANHIQAIGLGTSRQSDLISAFAIWGCYTDPADWEKWLSGLAVCWQKPAMAASSMLNSLSAADRSNPVSILAALGNPSIAALIGAIHYGAANNIALVLDSAATLAAALLAEKLAPACRNYLIASHYAADPISSILLSELQLPAHLRLDMHLDEGCGAALGFTLLDASLRMLNDMKTFSEAEVAVADDGPGKLRQQK